jgi:hypothetical protein
MFRLFSVPFTGKRMRFASHHGNAEALAGATGFDKVAIPDPWMIGQDFEEMRGR